MAGLRIFDSAICREADTQRLEARGFEQEKELTDLALESSNEVDGNRGTDQPTDIPFSKRVHVQGRLHRP
jgi:hypothetical protein